MKIFRKLKIPKKYKGHVIAIGNFDGIHMGHQKVFNFAKKFAKKNKIKFGVLTFNPLPSMFFNKKLINYRLTSEKQKILFFKKYGVNFIINIKFNKKFSMISAKNFLENIIYKKIEPKFIFVSNNFKFGNKRKGDVKMLKKFSKKYKFKLNKISPLKFGKNVVSSTKIRKFLWSGKIDSANKFLSRTWFIDGLVKKGRGVGRKLGYRTCNIDIKNYIIPQAGIYSVKVFIDQEKKVYNGISYIGTRPTFGGKKIFLETYIFNFKKNLYQKILKVYFFKFLRGDKKFKKQENLIQQMNKDVILAKKSLKTKLSI